MYRDISSKIDCKTCGNCCKEVLPVLNQKDIERLSKGLNLSIHNFKDRYLIEEENNELEVEARIDHMEFHDSSYNDF